MQINIYLETLLFPSSPICSNFQFSIESSSGFAFSVLSALDFMNMKLICFSKKKKILINNHINKFY